MWRWFGVDRCGREGNDPFVALGEEFSMDGTRFDDLVRGAAGSRSRRAALKALGGGIAASAFAGLGLRSATAQEISPEACIELRRKCERASQCCGGDRFVCDEITNRCDRSKLRRKDRCCGNDDAECKDNCDCCVDHKCINIGGGRGKRCVRKNDR